MKLLHSFILFSIFVFNLPVFSQVQFGLDINGLDPGDHFGKSVSLSADGLTVAVGADQSSDSVAYGGHARVFEWNGNAWVQKGDKIFGTGASNGAGFMVKLSDDASTVAVSSPGENNFQGKLHRFFKLKFLLQIKY